MSMSREKFDPSNAWIPPISAELAAIDSAASPEATDFAAIDKLLQEQFELEGCESCQSNHRVLLASWASYLPLLQARENRQQEVQRWWVDFEQARAEVELKYCGEKAAGELAEVWRKAHEGLLEEIKECEAAMAGLTSAVSHEEISARYWSLRARAWECYICAMEGMQTRYKHLSEGQAPLQEIFVQAVRKAYAEYVDLVRTQQTERDFLAEAATAQVYNFAKRECEAELEDHFLGECEGV